MTPVEGGREDIGAVIHQSPTVNLNARRTRKQGLISHRLIRITRGKPILPIGTPTRPADVANAAPASADTRSVSSAAPLKLARDLQAKRVIDVCGATVLLLLFAPLMAGIAAVLAVSGGGSIYRPQRMGRHGTLFRMYKFRTMQPDADEQLRIVLEKNPWLQKEWNHSQKLSDDPRVTRFGKFLRRTSLDELPQLLNVIRGEMSLVGPRPVPATELHERYGEASCFYLAVKPGITGLWQVCGRSDTSYQQRVEMDIHYVYYHSLWLDLKIKLRTVWIVLTGKGAC